MMKTRFDPDYPQKSPNSLQERVISSYFDEMTYAMEWLGKKPDTYFIGQAVGYPGTGMTTTLKNVPAEKKLELPVAEEMQMGMSCGLALEGFVPISVYPRWNFLLCGLSGLVNHLDKYSVLSDYKPHVIIRVGIGSVVPLDPQAQHRGDFTDAIQKMCQTTEVVRLEDPMDIMPAYSYAYRTKGVHILCEVSDFFNEDFRRNYDKFRFNYGGF